MDDIIEDDDRYYSEKVYRPRPGVIILGGEGEPQSTKSVKDKMVSCLLIGLSF